MLFISFTLSTDMRLFFIIENQSENAVGSLGVFNRVESAVVKM